MEDNFSEALITIESEALGKITVNSLNTVGPASATFSSFGVLSFS